MKRFVILVAILAMSFSNFSCTSDNTEDVRLEQSLQSDEGDWNGNDLLDDDETEEDNG
jgi:hypothetical protein